VAVGYGTNVLEEFAATSIKFEASRNQQTSQLQAEPSAVDSCYIKPFLHNPHTAAMCE